MRFECPNCRRKGSLPDGTPLPKRVGCPACKTAFVPIPLAEPPPRLPGTVPAPVDAGDLRRLGEAISELARPQPSPLTVTPIKVCEYCGETIHLAAKKCKHCGEVLDPALRSAEEAKRIALSGNNQVVVTNNVAASASATAGEVRRSLMGQIVRYAIVTAGCFVLAFALGGASETPVFGMFFLAVGLLLVVVGIPYFIIKSAARFIFG